MECEYCNKKFSSKGNLSTHQRTAKYCINKRDDKVTEPKEMECKYCSSKFIKKWNFKRHLEICKIKNFIENKEDIKDNETKEEIEKLKIEKEMLIQKLNEEKANHIIDLKKQLENMQELLKNSVSKPSPPITLNNQNNNQNNITKNSIKYANILAPMNLTKEFIEDKFNKNFNKSHFFEGPAGLAGFCYQNFVRNEDGKLLMACSDPARKNFIYIDENGDAYKDYRAQRFTKMIIGPFNDKCKAIIKEIFDKYRQFNIDHKPDSNGLCYDLEMVDKTRDIGVLNLSISNDNTPFLTKFAILCDTGIYKEAIEEIAKIEKEVFGSDSDSD